MSEQEILDSNRLIADFMQIDYSGKEQFMWRPGAYIPFTEKCLRYHSSWSWIMPVIEKIEKEFTVKIIRYADELSNVCEIETTEDDPLQITYCCGYDYDGKTKIQVVFDAVVEFIKWYNQNK